MLSTTKGTFGIERVAAGPVRSDKDRGDQYVRFARDICFFRPFRAWVSPSQRVPRLAPWAAFFRRFAAGSSGPDCRESCPYMALSCSPSCRGTLHSTRERGLRFASLAGPDECVRPYTSYSACRASTGFTDAAFLAGR